MAHLGTPEYEDFRDPAERYGEVRPDTTTAFTDSGERRAPFPAGALPRPAGLGDRVLLGPDSPGIPYPYVHRLRGPERPGPGGRGRGRSATTTRPARLSGLPG